MLILAARAVVVIVKAPAIAVGHPTIRWLVELGAALRLVVTPELVRDNLWLNLKGDIIDWWDGELSDPERRLRRTMLPGQDELAQWTTLPLARFKEPSDVALTNLMKEKYTVQHAANRQGSNKSPANRVDGNARQV